MWVAGVFEVFRFPKGVAGLREVSAGEFRVFVGGYRV